jgi:hypothetical protein
VDDGNCTGRQIVYFEDGELAGTTYWLENKRVSKKRYIEACEEDPRLPRYDDDALTEPPAPSAGTPSDTHETAESAEEADAFCRELLAGPAVREAREWLAEGTSPLRSLGEAADRAESQRLVDELYGLGAVTVWAVEIDGAPNDEQNSGKLVIELPTAADQRAALFDFCGESAEEMGFDRDKDVGQRYLFVMLD